jgi:hypothetical protein
MYNKLLNNQMITFLFINFQYNACQDVKTRRRKTQNQIDQKSKKQKKQKRKEKVRLTKKLKVSNKKIKKLVKMEKQRIKLTIRKVNCE